MSQNSQTVDPMDPFGQWQSMRDKSMEAWSKMMLEFVHSDAYASASARWLDAYLTMSQSLQRMMSESMTHTLSTAKIASTDDMTRLAERLFNVELKLDDLDARFDKAIHLLERIAHAQTAVAAAAPKPPSAPAHEAEKSPPAHPAAAATVHKAAATEEKPSAAAKSANGPRSETAAVRPEPERKSQPDAAAKPAHGGGDGKEKA